jgi:hypothetical protein
MMKRGVRAVFLEALSLCFIAVFLFGATVLMLDVIRVLYGS